MSLLVLRDLLEGFDFPAHHFNAAKETSERFVVWEEVGEAASEYGDDVMIEQAVACSVVYFTSVEYDTNVDMMQEAFDEAGFAYQLQRVGRDLETNLIRYMWRVIVPCGGGLYANAD